MRAVLEDAVSRFRGRSIVATAAIALALVVAMLAGRLTTADAAAAFVVWMTFIVLTLLNEAHFIGQRSEEPAPRLFHVVRILLLGFTFGAAMAIAADASWQRAILSGLFFAGAMSYVDLFRFWWDARAPQR